MLAVAGKRETTQNIGHVKINIKDVVRNRRLQDIWALQVGFDSLDAMLGGQDARSRRTGRLQAAQGLRMGFESCCCKLQGLGPWNLGSGNLRFGEGWRLQVGSKAYCTCLCLRRVQALQ